MQGWRVMCFQMCYDSHFAAHTDPITMQASSRFGAPACTMHVRMCMVPSVVRVGAPALACWPLAALRPHIQLTFPHNPDQE